MAAGYDNRDDKLRDGITRNLIGIIRMLKKYQVFVTVSVHLHPYRNQDADFDDNAVKWYIEQR